MPNDSHDELGRFTSRRPAPIPKVKAVNGHRVPAPRTVTDFTAIPVRRTVLPQQFKVSAVSKSGGHK